MDYDQVLDGICEAMNILEGKGGQAKSDRHVYHIGEELCNDDTGDKYDEIVIRYDPNEFLSTNGCGLYATIASRFANEDIAVSLAETVCSALMSKIIAETDIAKECGYTFADIADYFADAIEDIEKAMEFRRSRGYGIQTLAKEKTNE